LLRIKLLKIQNTKPMIHARCIRFNKQLKAKWWDFLSSNYCKTCSPLEISREESTIATEQEKQEKPHKICAEVLTLQTTR